jgi:integral membrane sensor domain MASE1
VQALLKISNSPIEVSLFLVMSLLRGIELRLPRGLLVGVGFCCRCDRGGVLGVDFGEFRSSLPIGEQPDRQRDRQQ